MAFEPGVSPHHAEPQTVLAARLGESEKVLLLLDTRRGTVVDRSRDGQPLLLLASARGDTKLVSGLLCRGADPNGVGGGSWSHNTAIMQAAARGHMATAALLLASGADASRRSGLSRKTAAEVASAKGYKALAHFIEMEHAKRTAAVAQGKDPVAEVATEAEVRELRQRVSILEAQMAAMHSLYGQLVESQQQQQQQASTTPPLAPGTASACEAAAAATERRQEANAATADVSLGASAASTLAPMAALSSAAMGWGGWWWGGSTNAPAATPTPARLHARAAVAHGSVTSAPPRYGALLPLAPSKLKQPQHGRGRAAARPQSVPVEPAPASCSLPEPELQPEPEPEPPPPPPPPSPGLELGSPEGGSQIEPPPSARPVSVLSMLLALPFDTKFELACNAARAARAQGQLSSDALLALCEEHDILLIDDDHRPSAISKDAWSRTEDGAGRGVMLAVCVCWGHHFVCSSSSMTLVGGGHAVPRRAQTPGSSRPGTGRRRSTTGPTIACLRPGGTSPRMPRCALISWPVVAFDTHAPQVQSPKCADDDRRFTEIIII
jgi:hypothetical protein